MRIKNMHCAKTTSKNLLLLIFVVLAAWVIYKNINSDLSLTKKPVDKLNPTSIAMSILGRHLDYMIKMHGETTPNSEQWEIDITVDSLKREIDELTSYYEMIKLNLTEKDDRVAAVLIENQLNVLMDQLKSLEKHDSKRK